jgi:hypothetical protein
MRKNLFAVITSDEALDCFGDFNKSDRLCAKYCILRLRCAIEQEQILRSALLEELVASENAMGKPQ